MKQIAFSRGRSAYPVDVPVPALKSGAVLVETHFSAISVGTERQAAQFGSMNLVQKALARPQQVVQVARGVMNDGLAATYRRAKGALEEWMPGGYSNAGVVCAVASDVMGIRVGDRVACGGGGYALHAEYCVVPQRLIARVADHVSLDDAAFATIGAVAMHGFRVGDVGLSEHVAVIGLGIIGQMLCQISAAAGSHVIPMDIDPERVGIAAQLAGKPGVLVGSGNEEAEIATLTGRRGVDVVFVCVASVHSEPMKLASRIARDRGRLVVVGDVGLHLDRQTLYDKELDLRISRSYGPGRYDPAYEQRGNDYPYSYVRWTEQRNIESVVDLMAREKLQVKPLVTHRFRASEAERAFELLADASERGPIGALFEYDRRGAVTLDRKLTVRAGTSTAKCRPRIALVGPGAFARNVILPALAKHAVSPAAIVGSSSLAPTQVAAQASADYVTTDFEAVLADDDIDTLIITSRHDSHADMTIAGLAAGKNVYVEKPLAMTIEELERICAAYNTTERSVMVGFNRRFAPLTRKVRAFLPPSVPPVLLYRVNAGPISSSHWSMSAGEGGGRIIGEACHFVDLLQFLAGSPVRSVHAIAQRDSTALEQDVCVNLSFRNGAIGTLIYTAQGNSQHPKEYLEVFAGGKVAIIDDFTRLTLLDGSKRVQKRAIQDKGFEDEMNSYLEHLLRGGPCPIPFEDLLNTSLATISIVESYRTGAPVTVPEIQTREK